MTSIADFLFPAPAPRQLKPTIQWWESRRLAYNVAVGGAGIVSLGAMTILGALPPLSRPMDLPPLAVLAFGLAANVCYCAGPVADLLLGRLFGARLLPTGPALYRMGLTFSVGLALLPTLLSCFEWGIRVVRWGFGLG